MYDEFVPPPLLQDQPGHGCQTITVDHVSLMHTIDIPVDSATVNYSNEYYQR